MKKNNFLKNLLICIVIFLLGVLSCWMYFKYIEFKDTTAKDTEDKAAKTEVVDNTSENSAGTDEIDNNESNNSSVDVTDNTKPMHTEEFINQDGETVKITAEKIIGATGYAGSSNDKFFLKDGNLYYMNISGEKKEVLLATSVKDLYLENYEVYAELNSDGKIVKENNYINYK